MQIKRLSISNYFSIVQAKSFSVIELINDVPNKLEDN